MSAIEGEVVNPVNDVIPDLPSIMQTLVNVYHQLSSIKRGIQFMQGSGSDDLLESLTADIVRCNMHVEKIHKELWYRYYKPV